MLAELKTVNNTFISFIKRFKILYEIIFILVSDRQL